MNGENVNFEEWQDELRAGHTNHVQYHDWLSERIDDNRRLIMEAAAVEEQNRDKRLLANSLAGWGNGLNRTATAKVVMSIDRETSTQLRSVAEKPPSPAPTAEQQRALLDPMTSSDGPLLSDSIPHGTPLLPGTVTKFPQDFNSKGSESDRSNKSFGTDAKMELNYDGTSSEEEKPTSNDQPV